MTPIALVFLYERGVNELTYIVRDGCQAFLRVLGVLGVWAVLEPVRGVGSLLWLDRLQLS
jgi:hypothetical protein